MTFVPRGYGGFPSVQFSPPNQINNRYYNDGYKRRDAYFAPHYPSRPLYQPPFHPHAMQRSSAGFDRAKQPSLGQQFLMAVEEFDEEYRNEQYLRRLQKIERQCSQFQTGVAPYPMYPAPPIQQSPTMQLFSPPFPYNPGPQAPYQRPAQYAPYPAIADPRTGYCGPSFRTNYGAGALQTFGTISGINLPPKIRVIFIPAGQSFSQQPCTGPLAAPPFLYNRISQPLSSFPLPPPLPQLGCMPLTPAVQQMVVQRYSNPVAVLPSNINWQMPQPMMAGCPQVFPQQQQPMPICQPFPSAPPLMPAFSSLQPIPQTCIPYSSTAPTFSSLPPGPYAYSALPPPPPLPPPVPAFSSLPPASQPYIPPPPFPIMSSNHSMLPSSSLQPPLSYPNAVPSSQYANTNYPNMCRACPPAPPPLNMLVSGHCWVQHCAACHHVPSQDTNSNVRSTSGRITPLLRHPTVPQYTPDQTQQQYQQQQQQQQQQDPYGNTSVMTRPWLRKTPPLPPNCAIVYDGYYNTGGSGLGYDELKNQYRRRSRDHYRSTSTSSRSTPSLTASKTSKSISPRRASKSSSTRPRNQGFVPPKKQSHSSSASTSSSGLSAEYHRTTLYSANNNKNDAAQQLAGEARNVNLQYNYQTQEVPTVYNINRYLKSSSEESTTSSPLNRRRLYEGSPSQTKETNQIFSPISDLSSIREESNFPMEDGKPPRPPSQSKAVKEKLIIIREFVARSPSTISTVSSDATFSVIDNDMDSVSSESTIKADTSDNDDDIHPKMF